jgi:hypothetical protein
MLIKVLLSRPAQMLVGAQFAASALEGLAHVNKELVLRSKVPRLYQSGVRWIEDKKGEETFIDALHVLKQGGADCSSLSAWRVGELWADNERANIHLHWRGFSDGFRLYHVTVRRADGSIEDPSRLLGMPV